MKDSALYPVLKRLQEHGYVDTYDRQYQDATENIIGSPMQAVPVRQIC